MEFGKVDGVVNGAKDLEIESEEKILKPRKSVSANEQKDGVIQNGKNENESGSENENFENGYDENGYDNEGLSEKTNKQHKKGSRLHSTKEKKESTPKKPSKLDSRASTPKQDTPTKRELRRRDSTPRESTPKPEIKNKRESKRSGTPAKIVAADNTEESKIIEESEQNKVNEEIDFVEDKEPTSNEEVQNNADESVLILEEIKKIDEDLEVNIDENEEYIDIDDEEIQQNSIFPVSQRISENTSSIKVKDTCEASSSSSSPSVICLGTPSIYEEQHAFSSNIKGRKPINSFSRFPGRVVSNRSLEKSLKRKSDDSFINDRDRKRYAGETESGSEQSPGWHFFSSFNRVWSPTPTKTISTSFNTKTQEPVLSSTPFHRMTDQDSMAVNYDEETKLSLDDSNEIQIHADDDPTFKFNNRKWCTVM